MAVPTKDRYDCVVIGGGHNGLVCAAYLAKSGRRVCVLERRHVLGGCATTEALWPGYKVSTAAYVVSLFQPQIIQELRLAQYGLKILARSPSSFTPLPDGRSLLLGPDEALCRREIGKFSPPDAEAYPRYNALLERVAAAIDPILTGIAPDALPLPRAWRKVGLVKKLRDLRKLWAAYRSSKSLGNELPQAIELLAGAARPILDRWFETEALKATLATDAIIGAMTSISAAGSAYVLLHHVMGEAGGSRGVWGYVEGGMGALSNAIASACTDLGVVILRETPVHRILVHNGRTAGVELADGKTIDAANVASSIDAQQTFLRLLGSTDLPADFRQAVERIDYSSASAKINLALGEPPRFTAAPVAAPGGIGPQHHGTIHISPTQDYIERAFADAVCGRPSQRPVLELTIPTSLDRTIAPSGKHLMSMFVQYAPYRLTDGVVTWDDIKESFADRCIDVLAEYAPNVRGAIEHRQVLSPLDLERTFGLTGGNIMQGAMTPHQLYSLRPVPGWADHRSPIRGLYLCGAASHPGGGVMGICGKNAAAEILRDAV
ncbi:MAG: NAD(P)/FAD-dependent oxidoreductase [Pirellulales bacterium]